MKILFIGDIVGSPGRQAVKELLPRLKEEFSLDFVIANAENAAGGSGIIPKVAEDLFSSGVDVLTSGDHIWKKQEVFALVDQDKRVMRPINFPEGAPGSGATVFSCRNGKKIAVINVQGRVFMEALDCPFRTARKAIEEVRSQTQIIILDIHAEATSEKMALGWYLDGLVSAILGTHTHVQTADERIMPKGTAYLTDVGMTGPLDSVIGRRVEDVLKRFLTSIPVKFEIASDNIQLQGAIVEIDDSGKARSILRIQRKI